MSGPFAWRGHRRAPAEVRELRRLDLAPNPDGTGLVVAVNPNAGSADGALAAELRELLPAAEVIELEDPGDLGAVLEKAASADDTVATGAAGGAMMVSSTCAGSMPGTRGRASASFSVSSPVASGPAPCTASGRRRR